MITICIKCGELASESLAHECAGVCPICAGTLKDVDKVTQKEWAVIENNNPLPQES